MRSVTEGGTVSRTPSVWPPTSHLPHKGGGFLRAPGRYFFSCFAFRLALMAVTRSPVLWTT